MLERRFIVRITRKVVSGSRSTYSIAGLSAHGRTREDQMMKREQLIERVAEWSLARFGQDFPGSLFDDLVEDGLIPKGERQKNLGIHPVYDFACPSYRRARQIARLRSKGIVGRDAIRVQLFLRGYSQPVWDVREALRKEYVSFVKAISKKIRSSHANGWGEIGPSHKASFVGQAGELDRRFEAAGLKLAADQIIEFIRYARQQPVKQVSESFTGALEESLRRKPAFQQLAAHLVGLFSGLLMFEPDLKVSDIEVSELSKLISSVEDEAFIRARRLYGVIVHSRFRGFWQVLRTDTQVEERRPASEAALSAIRDEPGFAAATLVQCLRLQELPQLKPWLSSDDDCDNLLSLLQFSYEGFDQNTGPRLDRTLPVLAD